MPGPCARPRPLKRLHHPRVRLPPTCFASFSQCPTYARRSPPGSATHRVPWPWRAPRAHWPSYLLPLALHRAYFQKHAATSHPRTARAPGLHALSMLLVVLPLARVHNASGVALRSPHAAALGSAGAAAAIAQARPLLRLLPRRLYPEYGAVWPCLLRTRVVSLPQLLFGALRRRHCQQGTAGSRSVGSLLPRHAHRAHETVWPFGGAECITKNFQGDELVSPVCAS